MKQDLRTKIIGDLIIAKGEQIKFPNLNEISSNIYLSENAKLDAPVLTTSGYICLRENNATYKTKYTSIEFVKGQFKTFKHRNKKYNAKRIDGLIFIVESEKTTKGIKIYSGFNLKGFDKGQFIKNQCYISEKDGFFAHGETIKKAISDVQFKAIADQLKKEPIKPETIITDQYYRIITGACEMGIKSWKQSHNVKADEITAKELLPILEKTNAYGYERFKQLCNF